MQSKQKIIKKVKSFKLSRDSHHFIRGCYPVGIYLLKVNNRNTRTKCEICSKFTIKTPE